MNKNQVIERINELRSKIDRSEFKILKTKRNREWYGEQFQELFENFELINIEEDGLSVRCIKIANQSRGVVIGGHGAYVEFGRSDLAVPLVSKPGEEWRQSPRWAQGCKYEWFITPGLPDIKIYKQINTVDYADYKIGFYYIDNLCYRGG